MKKVELLAPAGDLERLKVNLLYGADAVYIGGEKYGLRANATNFSLEEIQEGCAFAHRLSKKVFLTLNMVFHNEDMGGVEEYIQKVVDAGIDAFIVSDLFLISYITKNYPEVEVHLSTQNSTTNFLAVSYFSELGVKRIVLARELSKEEIADIIKETHMDIEVFIHGAMCTCFSGRCTLSNYVTGRDANRGGCAQVCRFAFQTEEDQPFTMATKDLNMARYIPDLLSLGVASFKVEGRMRSLYYLATVIGCYRHMIDLYYDHSLTDSEIEQHQEVLARVANRETSSHYFEREADERDQYYTGRQEISNQDYLGLVTGYDLENHCLILVERNYFETGDLVEIFTPTKEVFRQVIDVIYDEEMTQLEVARHPEQVLKIPFEKELPVYSMMRLIEKGRSK